MIYLAKNIYPWWNTKLNHFPEWRAGVNFINILRAFFCHYFGAKNYKAETFGFVIFWRQNFVQKNARVKCWWNWLQISSFVFDALRHKRDKKFWMKFKSKDCLVIRKVIRYYWLWSDSSIHVGSGFKPTSLALWLMYCCTKFLDSFSISSCDFFFITLKQRISMWETI